jgi:hypothetical protein
VNNRTKKEVMTTQQREQQVRENKKSDHIKEQDFLGLSSVLGFGQTTVIIA